MRNEREFDLEIRRILARAGVTPRSDEKTPDWIGSADGPRDLSENLDRYLHEAREAAEADSYGLTVDELRAKRAREGSR